MIELPRSTFYYRPTAPVEALGDERLIELIGDIQDELPGYGYRRVTRELQRRGHLVNHKRIARVMKAHGLGIRPRRRFVRTTDSAHDLPIFPNLYRNVIPTTPYVVWVADFTYVHPHRGWLLLPGGHPRCLQPQGRGLRNLPAHRYAACAGSVRCDGKDQAAAMGLHSSYGSRMPICK